MKGLILLGGLILMMAALVELVGGDEQVAVGLIQAGMLALIASRLM